MKIVIIGGGTAGWITAALLVKYTKDHDVTVVDSTKIGIIGAGEGSTGTLPWVIRDMWPDKSINEIDFLRKTKGTIKLGINLVNWKGDGTQIYSPFHGSPTDTKSIDTAFIGSILKYGRGDMASMHSWMLDDKLTTFRKVNGRITQAFENHSYHFDGVEVGKFFKEWCTKRGVTHIDSEVERVNFDDREWVETVDLANGQKLEAPMWFDCSGFNKVLMGKTRNKWISFKEHLPCNTAIPFSTDINSKTVKFETEAYARDAGWTWKIPLQHRHGCGYVFCDGFTTEDKAIQELENKLRQDIDPIKTIKFDPGRWDRVWYNNIVAVGLSQNFLEPLQATSIHTSVVSVANLIFHYMKGEVLYWDDRNKYNELVGMMIDDYKDFIQMHYLTGRQDTPFWKFITNDLKISDKNQYLINASKFRTPTPFDIQQSHGSAGYPLWCHILDNSGLYNRDLITTELQHFGNRQECLDEIAKLKRGYDKIKPELVTNEELFKYLKI